MPRCSCPATRGFWHLLAVHMSIGYGSKTPTRMSPTHVIKKKGNQAEQHHGSATSISEIEAARSLPNLYQWFAHQSSFTSCTNRWGTSSKMEANLYCIHCNTGHHLIRHSLFRFTTTCIAKPFLPCLTEHYFRQLLYIASLLFLLLPATFELRKVLHRAAEVCRAIPDFCPNESII